MRSRPAFCVHWQYSTWPGTGTPGSTTSTTTPGDKNSTESDFLVISKIFTSVFSM